MIDILRGKIKDRSGSNMVLFLSQLYTLAMVYRGVTVPVVFAFLGKATTVRAKRQCF